MVIPHELSTRVLFRICLIRDWVSSFPQIQSQIYPIRDWVSLFLPDPVFMEAYCMIPTSFALHIGKPTPLYQF